LYFAISEAQLFYWRTAYCKVVSNNTEHSWFNGDGDGDEFYGMGGMVMQSIGMGLKLNGDGVVDGEIFIGMGWGWD